MTNAEVQRLLDDGVAILKTTTVGWANHSASWQQNKSTKWWQGLDKIAQARAALDVAAPTPVPVPPPNGLPFPEAVLENPIRPVIGATASGYTCSDASRDYLFDFGWVPRPTFVLSGSARNVQIRNLYEHITAPISTGPYWRGGLGLQVKADHVSVTGYLADGPTLTDGFRIACDPRTRITLQNARIEARNDATEAAEHLDALQIQGPLAELNVGHATLYAAGVRAPNDGGKCFQLNTIGVTGFRANLHRINMVGLGIPGTSRSGVLLGSWVQSIALSLYDVWATVDGSNPGSFPWAFPGSVVSGTAPSRLARFSSGGATGELHEGRPAAGDVVTRERLLA